MIGVARKLNKYDQYIWQINYIWYNNKLLTNLLEYNIYLKV